MRILIIFSLITVVLFTFSCTSKSVDTPQIERVQSHMGTYARIVVEGGTNENVDAAFDKIAELDNLLSDYNPKSQISEINENAGIRAVQVDPQVVEVLTTAKMIASQTQGAFDPTIGALTIGVYRFGRDAGAKLDLEQIDKAKSLVNYRDLIIESDSVYLKNRGMMIDLGGIGKGYAIQKAVDVLEEQGVRGGIVSLSGDFKIFGERVQMAIKSPESDRAIASFRTAKKEMAISTSGNYERFVNVDGEIYHHLLVPETGKPGQDFLSLTVVTEDSSTLADGYATALFVMGKEKSLEFLQSRNDLGVFMVFPDKKTYYNKAFTNLVTNLKIEETSVD